MMCKLFLPHMVKGWVGVLCLWCNKKVVGVRINPTMMRPLSRCHYLCIEIREKKLELDLEENYVIQLRQSVSSPWDGRSHPSLVCPILVFETAKWENKILMKKMSFFVDKGFRFRIKFGCLREDKKILHTSMWGAPCVTFAAWRSPCEFV